jgi:tripartite ATP-independent transporter DctP family solute receptor
MGIDVHRLAHGHDQTTEEAYHAAALYLQDRLATETAGGYTTEIFPEAKLGSETEMLAAVLRGDLAMATVTAANAAVSIPELGLFSVPYLFQDAEHFRRVVQDESIRKLIADKIKVRQPSLHCLAYFTPGPRNLYTRTRPVGKAEDLRGLRMRVMASPIESRVWASLGTEPAPMPFRQIYDALAKGHVDAADDTVAVYGSQRHYEVAPFHMLTRHQWSLSLLVINASFFAALPDGIRSDLSNVGRDLTDHVVDFAVRSERSYLQRLRKNSAVNIAAVDEMSFRTRIEGMAESVAEDLSMVTALKHIMRLAG